MPRTEFSSASFKMHKAGLIDYTVMLARKDMTSMWSEIARRSRTTKNRYDEVLQVGDFSMAPVVPQLSAMPFDDFQTPYSLQVTPVKRGIAYAVSEEAIETDYLDLIDRVGRMIALAFNQTKEQVAANMINLATASDTNGPDGVPLASDSHPLEDGTTWDNNVTAALSITALEDAVERMMLQSSHRGNPMPNMGPFILWVHPSQYMLAKRLTDGPEQPQTANREKSQITNLIEARQNPYFTSTVAWALQAKNPDEQPIVWLNRRPFRTRKDQDIIKEAEIFASSEMYTVYQDKSGRGFEYSAGTG
jgi:hypothetical protein